MKSQDRSHVEPEPSNAQRIRVGDDPMMVALIVGGSLALLVAIRGGFRGVAVRL